MVSAPPLITPGGIGSDLRSEYQDFPKYCGDNFFSYICGRINLYGGS